MTREEILKRIEKKQSDIKKIEKRIEKWTTGMSEEAKKIASDCELVYDDPKFKEAYNKYKEYSKEHENDPTCIRQDYKFNLGPNIEEAYSAYRDLAEAKSTLDKYQAQLKKIDDFNSNEKIQIIWDFLQNWKKEAYNFYVENAHLYIKLYKEENEKWEEYKRTNKQYLEFIDEYIKKTPDSKYVNDRAFQRKDRAFQRKFEENYYAPILSLSKDIVTSFSREIIDTDKLNKILDKDVVNKYNDFINRITEKAGKIIDVSRLKIAGNGIINGIVKGEKNNVKVETILAGGTNTNVIVNVKHGPILHYRVLVNIIN